MHGFTAHTFLHIDRLKCNIIQINKTLHSFKYMSVAIAEYSLSAYILR